ncbi:hypothetical protein JAAARDRAFT_294635 [Jaapia argillacea MUCL 33604]|uniref:Uncharacterized protein n=1 Tax=Jaapia argillacea MUCL 33604 TaxID=933084 RepID=A0A067PZ54_9AGAM|nr:hypothetical protein JAAARDRAFT_294635 [Jaapia argillacea MUCL 33604]
MRHFFRLLLFASFPIREFLNCLNLRAFRLQIAPASSRHSQIPAAPGIAAALRSSFRRAPICVGDTEENYLSISSKLTAHLQLRLTSIDVPPHCPQSVRLEIGFRYTSTHILIIILYSRVFVTPVSENNKLGCLGLTELRQFLRRAP